MRILRSAIFCFLLLVAAPLVHAQDTLRWDLEQCIDYAMKNNIQVKQSGLNEQLGKNNYRQSYLNVLPSINGFITNDFTNGQQFSLEAFRVVNQTTKTFSTGASADLTLFAGLQQVHNILKSRQDLAAARYDREDLKNTITLNITTAFLQIMTNKEVLAVAENQRNTTQTQLNNVQQRVSVGILPETNLLDLQAQLARDEANITDAQNGYDLAVLALRLLLQLKPDEPFEPQLPQVQESLTDLMSASAALATYNTAVLTQPSIKAAMARVQSAAFSRKIAAGAFSPSITMSANLFDYYTNQQRQLDTLSGKFTTIPIRQQFDDQFRKTVTFTLSIPIFSKGQRITNLQNSKLQYENAKLQLASAKNSLMQTVYEADANARAAASAYLAGKKSYEAAKRAFDAQQKRFDAGVASTLDYQTAKNNLANAESDMIKNKYTYIFRLKVLDFYQGKPISLTP